MTDIAARAVPSASAAPVAAGRVRDRRQVALWLLACCALVFAMIVLGGVTRLTGSGLSMVDWKPVTGVLPPIAEADWQREFDAYRASPEFRLKNHWMGLEEFKRIYWFEFGHRLLGRTIGLVFLAGFLWLLARRRIERALVPQLVLMFVLGGLQGLLGWYMVKSGLVLDPHVSQYRLTAHLAAALVIYVYMLKVALGLLSEPDPPRARASEALRRGTLAVCALLAVTILSGGFVAGLKAGLFFNSFPLMEGRLVPSGYLNLSPWWLNLFENAATAQFNHRVLATLTLVAVLALGWRALRSCVHAAVRLAFAAAMAMVLLQAGLGVATLLMRVPVALGAAHQAGAVLLLTALVVAHHALSHRRASLPAGAAATSPAGAATLPRQAG